MNAEPHLPRAARWLLRRSPVPPDARSEVESDLHELFAARRRDRGAVHAHWRLYRDIASLWRSQRVTRALERQSPLAFLRDVRGDVAYAARLFARQPAILLLTIVGLSLGLGIATAAFSIVNAVLRGEGLVEPDRAPAVLRTTDRSLSTAWTYEEFLRLREGDLQAQVEAVLTESATARTTPGDGARPSIGIGFVSGGFFAATGGRVAMGRPLVASDEQLAGAPAVVVSHAFWASTLNEDAAAVGRTIWIGRTAATIVGVARNGFSLPNHRQLWMPLTAYGAVYDATPMSSTPKLGVQVFARLSPDTTLAAAEAQLSGVAASLPDSRATGDSVPRVRLDPDAGLGRVPSSDTLAITALVFAVIALVLLLTGANVATVLIATALTRDREMGVRAALGASRARILRQLVTEGVTLGVIAASVGLLFAAWCLPIIARMIDAPAGTDLTPDLNVYLFLGLVTIITGVGAGLAPAWHSRRADLVTPLKGGDGARPHRVARRRLGSLLVMTQAAAAVLLIVLATLFVRATFRAATIDVGFDAAPLYAVSPGLGDPFANDAAGTRISGFLRRAMSELPAVPGIVAVTRVELTPFGGLTKTSITRDEPPRVVHFNRADGEFFGTMGLRLLTGRAFTRDDVAAEAPVAVVSESLARTYWRDQSPLGQLLPAEIPIPQVADTSTRPVIIGVVADATTTALYERSRLAVYQPLDAASERFAELLIRVERDRAEGVTDEVSRRLRAIDPQAEVRIASIGARLEQEASRPRLLATLTGFVGVVAIVLCGIGLYGLTAAVVAQRRREMGVRVAIGASPADLLRLLMWESLRPVLVGLVIGTGAALLAGRVVVAATFFGVSPQDPRAFTGATVILLIATALAVYVPTRRAAAVDAAVVLRQT